MAGIFINYRREDSKGFATALDLKLKHYFGREQIFMDVGSIRAGDNFPDTIEKSIRASAVFLILIGPNWIKSSDTTGLRLHQSSDWVRREIELAIKTRMTIIPILLDGAAAPSKHELPPALHSLADLHMAQISHSRFDTEVDSLAEQLAQHVTAKRLPTRPSTGHSSAPGGWVVSLKHREKRVFSLNFSNHDSNHMFQVAGHSTEATLDGTPIQISNFGIPLQIWYWSKFQIGNVKFRVSWSEGALLRIKSIEVSADKKTIFSVV